MASGERKTISMHENEAISLRADMINGQFDISKEETEFMNLVRQIMSHAAKEIQFRAPATCDIGRFIAGMDALQVAKNLFCDAAILGKESDNRKKGKM